MENNLTPIDEIRKEVNKEENKSLIADDIVKEQYEKDKMQLVKNEKFQEMSKGLVEKGAEIRMQSDLLKILNEKQKNDLAEYTLNCEKSKLAYRQKKEKKVILEEVKSDVQKRKIDALWNRYGYMYSDRKDFIPNKTGNIQKEIANWWDNTNSSFKKVVKSTLKTIFWVGIGAIILLLGYRFFMWIAQNTQNLPNIN
jgi:hypothetical protein